MNYRIKEQYGCFFIEKEVTTSTEIESFKSRVFPFLFKPKKISNKAWFEIAPRGYISGLMMPSMKFKTKKDAQKAIENLSPKYHDVAQADA